MESGSRSSVEYEVEVEDGIASLYANDELVESIEENRMSVLLKEYLTNPTTSYIGESSSGIRIFKVVELNIEMAQIAADVARINSSLESNAAVANNSTLKIDQLLDQFRSFKKEYLSEEDRATKQ